MYKLGKYKTKTYTDECGLFIVKYWETEILRWDEIYRTVILDNGGWRSSSTRRKMNKAFLVLNIPLKIIQKNYEWWVIKEEKPLYFYNGMLIKY